MNATETPGGSGIPAGWYDDPSGHGLRWWDGEQWTEHVHVAETAASAGTADAAGGEREGAPPRDLVKLRERIRARGTKTVGMALGAIVLVIVVLALILSGGSDGDGTGLNPGLGQPGATNPQTGAPTSRKAAREAAKLRRQLKNGNIPQKAKKALQAEKKALEAAGTGNAQKQIEAAEAAAKKALNSSD